MYDESTAIHYAAYRPRLHNVLLTKCLNENDTFDFGLDVGCGTGRSSVLLAKYCKHVIAIDPSKEMLSKAEIHPKVSYLLMKGNLDIPDKKFNIITFAGSLFYCKSQAFYDRMIAHTVPGTTIIVYDFNIRLGNILEKLDLSIPSEINNYNHAEDFSGLNTARLLPLYAKRETISYSIRLEDLAHFLLSHHDIQQNLILQAGSTTDPIIPLSKKLLLLPKEVTRKLKVDLYYQKYLIN